MAQRFSRTFPNSYFWGEKEEKSSVLDAHLVGTLSEELVVVGDDDDGHVCTVLLSSGGDDDTTVLHGVSLPSLPFESQIKRTPCIKYSIIALENLEKPSFFKKFIYSHRSS